MIKPIKLFMMCNYRENYRIYLKFYQKNNTLGVYYSGSMVGILYFELRHPVTEEMVNRICKLSNTFKKQFIAYVGRPLV